MIRYLIIAFLLSILHSVLFFNCGFDVSVVLYMLPLLVFVVYVLKKEHKIKNKYGLLLIVPIILLSSIYFITDHWLFRLLNLIIIPLLLIVMYILGHLYLRYFLTNKMQFRYASFDVQPS